MIVRRLTSERIQLLLLIVIILPTQMIASKSFKKNYGYRKQNPRVTESASQDKGTENDQYYNQKIPPSRVNLNIPTVLHDRGVSNRHHKNAYIRLRKNLYDEDVNALRPIPLEDDVLPQEIDLPSNGNQSERKRTLHRESPPPSDGVGSYYHGILKHNGVPNYHHKNVHLRLRKGLYHPQQQNNPQNELADLNVYSGPRTSLYHDHDHEQLPENYQHPPDYHKETFSNHIESYQDKFSEPAIDGQKLAAYNSENRGTPFPSDQKLHGDDENLRLENHHELGLDFFGAQQKLIDSNNQNVPKVVLSRNENLEPSTDLRGLRKYKQIPLINYRKSPNKGPQYQRSSLVRKAAFSNHNIIPGDQEAPNSQPESAYISSLMKKSPTELQNSQTQKLQRYRRALLYMRKYPKRYQNFLRNVIRHERFVTTSPFLFMPNFKRIGENAGRAQNKMTSRAPVRQYSSSFSDSSAKFGDLISKFGESGATAKLDYQIFNSKGNDGEGTPKIDPFFFTKPNSNFPKFDAGTAKINQNFRAKDPPVIFTKFVDTTTAINSPHSISNNLSLMKSEIRLSKPVSKNVSSSLKYYAPTSSSIVSSAEKFNKSNQFLNNNYIKLGETPIPTTSPTTIVNVVASGAERLTTQNPGTLIPSKENYVGKITNKNSPYFGTEASTGIYVPSVVGVNKTVILPSNISYDFGITSSNAQINFRPKSELSTYSTNGYLPANLVKFEAFKTFSLPIPTLESSSVPNEKLGQYTDSDKFTSKFDIERYRQTILDSPISLPVLEKVLDTQSEEQPSSAYDFFNFDLLTTSMQPRVNERPLYEILGSPIFSYDFGKNQSRFIGDEADEVEPVEHLAHNTQYSSGFEKDQNRNEPFFGLPIYPWTRDNKIKFVQDPQNDHLENRMTNAITLGSISNKQYPISQNAAARSVSGDTEHIYNNVKLNYSTAQNLEVPRIGEINRPMELMYPVTAESKRKRQTKVPLQVSKVENSQNIELMVPTNGAATKQIQAHTVGYPISELSKSQLSQPIIVQIPPRSNKILLNPSKPNDASISSSGPTTQAVQSAGQEAVLASNSGFNNQIMNSASSSPMVGNYMTQNEEVILNNKTNNPVLNSGVSNQIMSVAEQNRVIASNNRLVNSETSSQVLNWNQNFDNSTANSQTIVYLGATSEVVNLSGDQLFRTLVDIPITPSTVLNPVEYNQIVSTEVNPIHQEPNQEVLNQSVNPVAQNTVVSQGLKSQKVSDPVGLNQITNTVGQESNSNPGLNIKYFNQMPYPTLQSQSLNSRHSTFNNQQAVDLNRMDIRTSNASIGYQQMLNPMGSNQAFTPITQIQIANPTEKRLIYNPLEHQTLERSNFINQVVKPRGLNDEVLNLVAPPSPSTFHSEIPNQFYNQGESVSQSINSQVNSGLNTGSFGLVQNSRQMGANATKTIFPAVYMSIGTSRGNDQIEPSIMPLKIQLKAAQDISQQVASNQKTEPQMVAQISLAPKITPQQRVTSDSQISPDMSVTKNGQIIKSAAVQNDYTQTAQNAEMRKNQQNSQLILADQNLQSSEAAQTIILASEASTATNCPQEQKNFPQTSLTQDKPKGDHGIQQNQQIMRNNIVYNNVEVAQTSQECQNRERMESKSATQTTQISQLLWSDPKAAENLSGQVRKNQIAQKPAIISKAKVDLETKKCVPVLTGEAQVPQKSSVLKADLHSFEHVQHKILADPASNGGTSEDKLKANILPQQQVFIRKISYASSSQVPKRQRTQEPSSQVTIKFSKSVQTTDELPSGVTQAIVILKNVQKPINRQKMEIPSPILCSINAITAKSLAQIPSPPLAESRGYGYSNGYNNPISYNVNNAGYNTAAVYSNYNPSYINAGYAGSTLIAPRIPNNPANFINNNVGLSNNNAFSYGANIAANDLDSNLAPAPTANQAKVVSNDNSFISSNVGSILVPRVVLPDRYVQTSRISDLRQRNANGQIPHEIHEVVSQAVPHVVSQAVPQVVSQAVPQVVLQATTQQGVPAVMQPLMMQQPQQQNAPQNNVPQTNEPQQYVQQTNIPRQNVVQENMQQPSNFMQGQSAMIYATPPSAVTAQVATMRGIQHAMPMAGPSMIPSIPTNTPQPAPTASLAAPPFSSQRGNLNVSKDLDSTTICIITQEGEASEVLNRVLVELASLKKSKASGIDSDAACSINGTWLSNTTNTTIGLTSNEGLVKVILSPNGIRASQKSFFLNGGNWTFEGRQPNSEIGVPFVITGFNDESKTVAAFTGQCRVCSGEPQIAGAWSLSRASLCSRLPLAAEHFADSWYRRPALGPADEQKLLQKIAKTYKIRSSKGLEARSASRQKHFSTTTKSTMKITVQMEPISSKKWMDP